jgi:hypothetical protein
LPVRIVDEFVGNGRFNCRNRRGDVNGNNALRCVGSFEGLIGSAGGFIGDVDGHGD